MSESQKVLDAGREVISITGEAIASLSGRLGEDFVSAVQALRRCRGRVVLTGLGKSGHVGRKVASTLSSTGTPATFIHATEAAHGDLGFLRREDLCILISKSGENEELAYWLPFLKEKGCFTIALSGKMDSRLAREVNLALDCSVEQEACPNDLAPSSSSTAALVMGDALAIALLQLRGFSSEDFLRLHPGGILGKRLSLRVRDLMHGGEELPWVRPETPLREALLAIIEGGLGMVCLLEEAGGEIRGLLTDGDLKRALLQGETAELLDEAVDKFASPHPRCTSPDLLATEALTLMEEPRPGAVTGLVVLDENGKTLGLIHIHDILRAGLG